MRTNKKPQIVVSAVNLSEMGPLTILQEALTCLAQRYAKEYEIVALVHRQSLVQIPNVTYMEFPSVKGSWVRRLKFEYFDLKAISRGLNVTLWFSLHDVTPNVIARRRAVYCHNPSAFFPFGWREACDDPGFGAFTLFYRFLYAINIKRNDYVVVQQAWMRDQFKTRYGIENIIVSHPLDASPPAQRSEAEEERNPYSDGRTRFFFPSYPRVFKNAEVALEAAAILERSGIDNFELWLTWDGTENTYAARLLKHYRGLKSVRFLGLLTRAQVFERYGWAECLLFPSRLETWGLPISEFKPFRKPILAADLPYARETMGSYDHAAFFDPMNSGELAGLMRSLIEGKNQFKSVSSAPIAPPFAPDWASLFEIMLPSGHRTGGAYPGVREKTAKGAAALDTFPTSPRC